MTLTKPAVLCAALTMPLMGAAPILSATGWADVTEPASRYDLDGTIEIPVAEAELERCRATLEQVFVGSPVEAEAEPVEAAMTGPAVRCVVAG
ncbi:hypothetical protein [Limimaricola pyoseonensis]|uniref:UrcA family protein n=1 Tax=Limimaricola pyoseonensis TaxID=521013 RepID=A0A1G7CVK6_9RHOB|nr:hypothetical protein [Limimaricola pyoseonensis]SDE43382.1 hypothetical protein SAMN04488567_1663 [Limimaricola pyoseonensis]